MNFLWLFVCLLTKNVFFCRLFLEKDFDKDHVDEDAHCVALRR